MVVCSFPYAGQTHDNKCKIQNPRETKRKTGRDPYTKQNQLTIESDADYLNPHLQVDIMYCM